MEPAPEGVQPVAIFFEETKSVEAVNSRLASADPRFQQIMTALTMHLHGFIREVEPTMDEWFQAIQFLTKTGQICDDKRQEWILLSDTLGVSMLVDAINNRRPGRATENTVLGPFHVNGAPRRQMGDNICLDGKGDPCILSGHVIDEEGNPVAGAILDVWQTNDDGFYDVQQPGVQPDYNMRGIFETGPDGKYTFQTTMPLPYSIPDDGTVGRCSRRWTATPCDPPIYTSLWSGQVTSDSLRISSSEATSIWKPMPFSALKRT
jgi:hydroxyquinol 1,2-dioxygenase